MKIWTSNISHIDDYVTGKLIQEDRVLFEARLVLDPVLKFHVTLHKRIISVAKLYGRKKVKAEIEGISRRLFRDPSKKEFQRSVRKTFDNN